MSVCRNNPIVQSWRVKAGSNLLSGTSTLAVEKVFLAGEMPTSPKDNDIALVKLQSPLHVSGELWHVPPRSKSPISRLGAEWASSSSAEGHV